MAHTIACNLSVIAAVASFAALAWAVAGAVAGLAMAAATACALAVQEDALDRIRRHSHIATVGCLTCSPARSRSMLLGRGRGHD